MGVGALSSDEDFAHFVNAKTPVGMSARLRTLTSIGNWFAWNGWKGTLAAEIFGSMTGMRFPVKSTN